VGGGQGGDISAVSFLFATQKKLHTLKPMVVNIVKIFYVEKRLFTVNVNNSAVLSLTEVCYGSEIEFFHIGDDSD
jgi:hypothetical protein